MMSTVSLRWCWRWTFWTLSRPLNFSWEFYVNILMLISALMWETVIFGCCMVAGLQVRGEMSYFGTVRCRIPFWLMCCKHYRNDVKICEVVAKSSLSLFMDLSEDEKCEKLKKCNHQRTWMVCQKLRSG